MIHESVMKYGGLPSQTYSPERRPGLVTFTRTSKYFLVCIHVFYQYAMITTSVDDDGEEDKLTTVCYRNVHQASDCGTICHNGGESPCHLDREES